jgi:hypothetical protein
MRILIRAVVFLVIVAAVGVVGLAIFSDLPAPTAEVSLPIDAM